MSWPQRSWRCGMRRSRRWPRRSRTWSAAWRRTPGRHRSRRRRTACIRRSRRTVAARQVRLQAREQPGAESSALEQSGHPDHTLECRAGGVRLLRDRPERCACRGACRNGRCSRPRRLAAGGDGEPGSGEAMPGVREVSIGLAPNWVTRPGAVRAAGPRCQQHGTGGVRELPAGRPRREAGRRADRRAGVCRVHRQGSAARPPPGSARSRTAFKELLGAAAVLYADETPARTAAKLHYVHVACTEFLTAMHTATGPRRPSTPAASWRAIRARSSATDTPATTT